MMVEATVSLLALPALVATVDGSIVWGILLLASDDAELVTGDEHLAHAGWR